MPSNSASFAGGSSQFTIELWFRTEAEAGAPFGFVIDHNQYPQRGGWDIISGQTGIDLELWGGDAGLLGALAPSQVPIVAGVWHYVVVEYDETGATTATIWVDNELNLVRHLSLKRDYEACPGPRLVLEHGSPYELLHAAAPDRRSPGSSRARGG